MQDGQEKISPDQTILLTRNITSEEFSCINFTVVCNSLRRDDCSSCKFQGWSIPGNLHIPWEEGVVLLVYKSYLNIAMVNLSVLIAENRESEQEKWTQQESKI